MIKYYCDRCSREVPDYSHGGKGTFSLKLWEGSIKDLCADCTNALSVWLRTP